MDFFHTHIAPQALQNAAETLRTGWLSEGRQVKAFEAALTEHLGLRRPVAVNSGTTALHLALVLAGVGPGDEVILPAQTFVATGLAILMQRARPVFADIDPGTGNLDPASVSRKITAKTKAIMPVHWAGYPCDLDEINSLAASCRAFVIEDAAHALGAQYRGRPVGAISDFTAFSFQAIKHLTTGDGGALCCLREEHAHAALVRRWFGIDRANSKPSILGERSFDIDTLGYKYHMNDLAASIGLGNLEDFPQGLRRRQQIAKQYRESLSGVPRLKLLRQESDRVSACWLFTVLVEGREDFIRKLAANGIPASVVHQRIDRYSVFGGAREDLIGQAEFDIQQVAIPLHIGLSDGDVEMVTQTISAGW